MWPIWSWSVNYEVLCETGSVVRIMETVFEERKILYIWFICFFMGLARPVMNCVGRFLFTSFSSFHFLHERGILQTRLGY